VLRTYNPPHDAVEGKRIIAFRPEMAVHGKYREPCPRCGSPVQRIVFADHETNYCATCQTEGRLLADRALSRLLKSDWSPGPWRRWRSSSQLWGARLVTPRRSIFPHDAVERPPKRARIRHTTVSWRSPRFSMRARTMRREVSEGLLK